MAKTLTEIRADWRQRRLAESEQMEGDEAEMYDYALHVIAGWDDKTEAAQILRSRAVKLQQLADEMGG